MSFLSGIKKVFGFLTGPGIGSTLARAAIAGFALRKLSQSAIKANEAAENENIDKGVRLQVAPGTQNKIPVLYGTAFFGGIITDAELSSNNQTMYYCVTLAEKTYYGTDSTASTYTFKDVYWNDNRVVFKSDGVTLDYTVDRDGTVDTSAEGLVKIYCFAGDSESPQVPTGYSNGSLDNAYDIMPSWTSSHQMNSLIFAVVEITYNREKSVTSLGDVKFEIENSMNEPGNVLFDYLNSSVYGAGVLDDYLDTSSFDALNTYSAESVNYTSDDSSIATLADRYQINGLIDTNQSVFSNVESICNACGSWLSFDIFTGKWGVIINKEGTTVADFDDSNILGNIRIQGTGIENLYNSVRVEFPNRDLRDTADFVKIDIPGADRNANEIDNILNIGYSLINEPIQAQLLGLIELKQSRVDLIVQFSADYSYMNLKAGELITVTSSRTGFSNKVFRILSISEVHDDDGALYMDITALEYDANVYSTDDLFRYNRSDATGILTIGSIGTPGTPQVTKFERDARPRVEIESTTPTGIVEGMEYWISKDYTETDDANRSYTLIATERPVGGGVFSSGTAVTLDIDSLAGDEFYVKTRGVNAVTVGPFSAPSGFVYDPTQITQAVNPNTEIQDGLGGLATTLGLLSLLGGVDGLFSKVTGGGSLFEKIFEAFNEDTGYDLRGEASAGTLVVPANIAIQEEGNEIVSQVSAINFVGTTVTATANGTIVTVDHTGDGNGGGGGTPSVQYLTGVELMPSNDTDPNTESAEYSPRGDTQWDVSGSCYIRYANSSVYTVGELTAGSGNYYLYKTDGTLVETVAATGCTIDYDVVEIPFGTRDYGTDYYILADEGVVTYCGTDSQQIASTTAWTFNTKQFASSDGTEITALTAYSSYVLRVESIGSLDCFNGNDLIVTFNNAISEGSGEILMKEYDTGNTIQTFPVTSAVIGGSTANFGEISSAANSRYYFEIPADIVLAGADACGVKGNTAYNSIIYDTGDAIEVSEVYYYKLGSEIASSTSTTGIEPETDFRVVFSDSFALGTGVITVGSQTIDPATATTNVFQKTGNTLRINPTVDFTPGSTVTLTIPASLIVGCSADMAADYTLTFSVDNLAMLDPTNINDDASSVPAVATFNTDRTVTGNTGNIKIIDESSTVVAEIPSDDASVTIQ